MRDFNRNDLQLKASKLIAEHQRLVLQWPTGLGKTRAALGIIEELKSTKILIVVAEVAHKNNWIEEFHKFQYDHLLNNAIIETYASLKNYREDYFDLLILDEGHHSGSELRLEILRTIRTKYLLVLSATLSSETFYQLEDIFGKMVDYKVTLTQAIEWGILPKPEIYLVPMELDNTSDRLTIVQERGIKRKRKYIKCSMEDRWKYLKDKTNYPDLTLEIKCTELQKYLHMSNEIEFWKKQFLRTRNEGVKNRWLQKGSERKRFLGNLKTEKADKVLRILRNKRFICFCSSIEQAEVLGGKYSIHSQKKGALGTIDDFNDKRINSLFTVGMIQEGQNLKDIEAGVIIQLDGQERAFIQKSGRAMRAEAPIIIVLYYKETRDEEYLQKILEGINQEYVTEITNLNDIKL